MIYLLLAIVIAILVALWLGTMALLVILPVRPGFVRIVRRLVCPRGADMVVETEAPTNHRSGGRTLKVYCVSTDGERRDVKIRALLTLWGVCVFVSLPLAAALVVLAWNLMAGAWG